MKRLCLPFLLGFLILVCSTAWAQTSLPELEQDVNDLLGIVEAHDQDLDDIVSILEEYDVDIDDIIQICELQTKRLDRVTDEDNKGAHDITSRKVLYRILVSYFSTAIRLQDKDQPVFSEAAFWDGIKDPKVKAYLKKHLKGNCTAQLYAEAGMIYPKMLADWLAAADAILYQAQPAEIDLEGLEAIIYKVDLLYDLVWDGQGRRLLATKAELAELESATNETLAEIREELRSQEPAPTIDTSAFATRVELSNFVTKAELAGFASQADVEEIRRLVLDEHGDLVFATIECVQAVSDQTIANAQMIEYLEQDTYLLSDKKREEARANRYDNLLQYYCGDHLKVQNHLRRRLWSEKHIREAAKANGSGLIVEEVDP